MDIILLERVEKLGHIGDIVSVKTGYARNFLLPKRKALRATAANKAKFEAERAQIEAENAKRREESAVVAETMAGASVVLIRQAAPNTGSLYGSVTSRNIAEALAEQGHKVTRQQVVLDRPIKFLGVETVKVVLHPEVSIAVKVNVARSPEEAELQAQGIDVMVDPDEREAEEQARAEAAAAAEAAALAPADTADEAGGEEAPDNAEA